MSACLSICLPVCPSVCLSVYCIPLLCWLVCLSGCLYSCLLVCLSACFLPFVCLSVHMYAILSSVCCLSSYLPTCLFFSLSSHLNVFLSVFYPVCLSLRLASFSLSSAYLSVCLFNVLLSSSLHACLSVFSSVCISCYAPACLSAYRSVCSSICLSSCVPVCMLVCMSVCSSVSLASVYQLSSGLNILTIVFGYLHFYIFLGLEIVYSTPEPKACRPSPCTREGRGMCAHTSNVNLKSAQLHYTVQANINKTAGIYLCININF
jgi:hypothetical protein